MKKRTLQLAYVALPLLLASGCAAPIDESRINDDRGSTINRHLEQYVRDFLHFYGQPFNALPIKLGPLAKGVAGMCYIPGPKTQPDSVADSVFGESSRPVRRIVISKSFYEKHEQEPDAIQQVVFHELGHCILDRGHSKARTDSPKFGDVPLSIMWPSAFGDKEYYVGRRGKYVEELFGRGSGKGDPAETDGVQAVIPAGRGAPDEAPLGQVAREDGPQSDDKRDPSVVTATKPGAAKPGNGVGPAQPGSGDIAPMKPAAVDTLPPADEGVVDPTTPADVRKDYGDDVQFE